MDVGLILVQIDGLSRRELEGAIASGRMPHVAELLERGRYRLRTMYSGLPSSTPAVQGELFYGRRGVVPAFGFRDAASAELVTMLQPAPAARVEAELEADGPGLLAGGSAYSDIFSGGAAETHFCPSRFSVRSFLPTLAQFTHPGAIPMQLRGLLIAAVLLAVEAVLGVLDLWRGVTSGEDTRQELAFVPARLAVCVLMRELITIGACIDAARGLPVVHVNFTGYDEQAHRRGPSSAFARWTLRGIDRAIGRLLAAARRARRRRYEVWVHSDHGQETTAGYERLHGEPFAGVVQRLAAAEGLEPVRVIAKGPIGHIYMEGAYAPERRQRLARALVDAGGVPLVLAAGRKGHAIASTPSGDLELPEDAGRVLGENHPFREECARDLVALVQNRHAGDLIVCGTRSCPPHLTFPSENGSHGGPGAQETCAFAVLPESVQVPPAGLRPAHLRAAALALLGRAP